MDEIRPWLYIGKFRDTLDKNYLDFKSIRAMLQLADPVQQLGIASLYLPVQDMGPTPPDFIKRGVEFIMEQKEMERIVLVACGAGINRSAAFCIAALKEAENLSLLGAFDEVKLKHRDAMPYEPVWDSLCAYYNEEISYRELVRVSYPYY